MKVAAASRVQEFAGYKSLLGEIGKVLIAGKRRAAWSLNAIMSAVYWDVGRRIVEFEQAGKASAPYGEGLIDRLAADLRPRFGRGFSRRGLFQMRAFYLAYRSIVQTPSAQLGKVRTPSAQLGKVRTPSAQSVSAAAQTSLPASKKAGGGRGSRKINPAPHDEPSADHLTQLTKTFPLPWSHYVRLLNLKSEAARRFYETEALQGGWSYRELNRQISTQLYERLALSRNKLAVLKKARETGKGQIETIDEQVRDPFVLEFLDLRDEYSESDLEEALVQHLGQFLIELGNDFCFVARQRRLRIGGEWYRIDLLFFHRKLRCLIVIDLKVGKFTHADAGQMNMYLNYAREHWTRPEENPPAGLILCAEKDDTVAHYSLQGLPNKVLAREYKLALPDEKLLAAELEKSRERLAQE